VDAALDDRGAAALPMLKPYLRLVGGCPAVVP
jgi:hypothetical protein